MLRTLSACIAERTTKWFHTKAQGKPSGEAAERACDVAAVRRVYRRGASIIEVLFSMGIVAVGLLGVLTILPVAGSRMTRGTVADSADRLGRNAFRKFEVLQMGKQEMWAKWDLSTTPPQYTAFTPAWTDSFCIDPAFLTRQMPVTAANWQCCEFPYCTRGTNATNRLSMARVNLRKYPGAVRSSATEALAIGDDRPPYPATGDGFNSRQADDIFLGQDDLVFDLPSDRTLLPVQNFGMWWGPDGAWGNAGVDDDGDGIVDNISEAGWPGSDDVKVKRQSDGNLSWLAMVTPSGGAADQCLLSIVVFNRRVLDTSAEKILRVAEFGDPGYQASDGMQGGEVTLESLDTTASGAEDLKMKAGEWIMLAGKNASGYQLFRWYRIQSAEREPRLVSGNWQRDMTLQGQDWPVSAIATLPNPPWPSNTATIAVWIPGTVAVYEKTFRRETFSLWTE